ncbi:MAG: hypothetical protein GYB68_02310 [Chloroflexi bacterium]|nr:hypothetical protein [Chloroflexota bacterium]
MSDALSTTDEAGLVPTGVVGGWLVADEAGLLRMWLWKKQGSNDVSD